MILSFEYCNVAHRSLKLTGAPHGIQLTCIHIHRYFIYHAVVNAVLEYVSKSIFVIILSLVGDVRFVNE